MRAVTRLSRPPVETPSCRWPSARARAFQFDWSEDWAVIGGERTKRQVAHFKLSHSRAFVVRAYPLQTHELLFDAHNRAFEVFGGVPRRGIYDNMKTAVDRVRRGKERDVNARFSAMVSHYLFEAEFCNPASGWEKGQVKKNVRDARHRLWLTDSHRNEFNCVGFAARLRDWSRLGRSVAQRGYMNGAQIVSTEWMDSYGRWGTNEAQVRFGALSAHPSAAYKNFFWHTKADGTRPLFSGAEGQPVLIDMPTQTVLTQTAVEGGGEWPAGDLRAVPGCGFRRVAAQRRCLALAIAPQFAAPDALRSGRDFRWPQAKSVKR